MTLTKKSFSIEKAKTIGKGGGRDIFEVIFNSQEDADKYNGSSNLLNGYETKELAEESLEKDIKRLNSITFVASK